MVMPFGDPIANACYTHSTKPIIEQRGFNIVRADEIFTNNIIFDDIETAIQRAHIVIVDISSLNPNCFYELGMSHSIKRNRTIMITHDEYDSLPFDISHFRIVQYSDTIEGKANYERSLSATLDAILSGLSSLYADEFEIVLKTLLNVKGTGIHDLYLLMALQKIDRPVRTDEKMDIEGRFSHPKETSIGTSLVVGNKFKTFTALGYIKYNEGLVSLTSKGQAFIEYLQTKGFVVIKVNGKLVEPMGDGYFHRVMEKISK